MTPPLIIGEPFGEPRFPYDPSFNYRGTLRGTSLRPSSLSIVGFYKFYIFLFLYK
jgi:hypothetical protein